jgi:hypothetical protein
MMEQAKELKQILKSIGATRWGGRPIRVRTEIRTIGHKMYEYGNAVAFVDPLTDEQKAIIMQHNKYAKIYDDKLGCLIKY